MFGVVFEPHSARITKDDIGFPEPGGGTLTDYEFLFSSFASGLRKLLVNYIRVRTVRSKIGELTRGFRMARLSPANTR